MKKEKFLMAVFIMTWIFTGLIFLFLIYNGCKSLDLKSDQNQTKQSNISSYMDKEASASALVSDCFHVNVKGQAGQNTRNCDELMKFYIKKNIYTICKKDKNLDKCYTFFK